MAIIGNNSRKAVTEKLNRLKEAALDAVFPEFCAGCEAEGELLCVECRGSARVDLQAAKCPFCERVTISGSVCRKCARSTSLDGCFALAHYAEPAVKGVIKKWKYQFAEDAEHQVAAWIRASNLEHVLPKLPWTVVPACLHPERKRWRGFDQSERLARLIASELGFEYSESLRRHKKTLPQAALGERRRQIGELQGAFVSANDPPPYVLLIDDVLTTGATLDAAAAALKHAGTESVWGLVLARGNKKPRV